MTRRTVVWAVLALVLSGCGERPDALQDFDPGPTPPEFLAGEALFDINCAMCHGKMAIGTNQGPPLVHQTYRPGHHADIAFQRAVQLGVAPHHFNFGPMPPVEGLPPDQVDRIIEYVRWLQRQAGIH